MFEDIVTRSRWSSTPDWVLVSGNIIYKGWFGTTFDHAEFDVDEKTGSVRIYSAVYSYVKFCAVTKCDDFVSWDHRHTPYLDPESTERALPTKKQIALHKLKHPPMFPDSSKEDFHRDFVEYAEDVVSDNDGWHSICDWEAYYTCSRE